jgi:hypothetical protein
MSAIKRTFDEVQQEFATDDTYGQYLQMQMEHEEEPQYEPKVIFDWKEQERNFFKESKQNYLPF